MKNSHLKLAGLIALLAMGSASNATLSIIASDKFKTVKTFLESDYDQFVRELIFLTEIPAPPFKEHERAKAFMELLRKQGLSQVEMDPEGNVMGIRKGNGTAPMVAILAHLDTVFPEGTDVKVKREGNRLSAPGIGDNTGGLALMLTMIRGMNAGGFETASDILFVGNVGEEGEGDLRGAKYLLEKGKYKDQIKLFLAIDGGEVNHLTNGALGSKRYRVTFKGPGGHSYGAFGVVNPSYALGNAIRKFASLKVPKQPKTTFNVGILGGGTSVNSIPFEVYMDVDMRSESPHELEKLVGSFRKVVDEAVKEENQTRSTSAGTISVDVKLIGDRPSGETPIDSPFIKNIASVLKAFDLTPRYSISSTDSNVPISKGIPAVTIGRGKGGRAHSLDEWIELDKTDAVLTAQVAIAILLQVAGGLSTIEGSSKSKE